MNMYLPKFDIYDSKVAPKSHTNSWCPDLFRKKFLSDVRSEINLVRRDIVSTRKSVQALKKCMQDCEMFFFSS